MMVRSYRPQLSLTISSLPIGPSHAYFSNMLIRVDIGSAYVLQTRKSHRIKSVEHVDWRNSMAFTASVEDLKLRRFPSVEFADTYGTQPVEGISEGTMMWWIPCCKCNKWRRVEEVDHERWEHGSFECSRCPGHSCDDPSSYEIWGDIQDVEVSDVQASVAEFWDNLDPLHSSFNNALHSSHPDYYSETASLNNEMDGMPQFRVTTPVPTSKAKRGEFGEWSKWEKAISEEYEKVVQKYGMCGPHVSWEEAYATKNATVVR